MKTTSERIIMNARNILKTSLIAALFAAGAAAQASPYGDGDALYTQPQHVQSTRSFQTQQAANLAGNTRGRATANFNEAYGEGVHAAGRSTVDRASVRAAAIQAQRSGEIERGDSNSF